MKKYIIVSLIVFIIPSVTFAAWWNPLTWFRSNGSENRPAVNQQLSSTTEPSVIVQGASVATTTPELMSGPSTIGGLSLQSKIDSLIIQVNTLESKLATAQNSYSICQASLTAAQNNTAQNGTIKTQSQPATSIMSTAKPTSITFSANDPSTSPGLSQPVSFTTTANGQYLGLPVLKLYLTTPSNDIYLRTLTVNFNSSGQGTVNTAYLYQGNAGSGSRPIATGIVNNGTVTFSISPANPLQIQLNAYLDSPNNLLTVKVDVSGLAKSGDAEVIAASAGIMTADTTSGQSVSVSGTANGNVITVTNTTL